MVSRQSTVVGRRREEDDVGAGIVAADAAVVAGGLHARDTALERHAVAGLVLCDAWTDIDHDAGTLMSKTIFAFLSFGEVNSDFLSAGSSREQ